MDIRKHDPEYREVKAFMWRFFENYYKKRSCKLVSEMVTDQILCIGLGSEEVGQDRASFEHFIRLQMERVSTPVCYAVRDYVQTRCGDHLWTCYALVSLRVTSGVGQVRYVIRMMATIQQNEGRWQFLSLHVSEPSGLRDRQPQPSFGTRVNPAETPRTLTQREIGYVLDQLIPGGIITRIAAEGFPIAIANQQFLSLTGFSAFQEYAEAQGGLFLNSIHPDDVEKFIYTASFIAKTGRQYESEYRIRRKDGRYLWVYDVSRKAVSSEGKVLIVSIITDMSDQIEYRHKLESESGIDFLTKVYNRKGARDYVQRLPVPYERGLLLVMDLDNFKLVNDLYGHIIGDQVLRYTAGLLTRLFGGQGLVCRLGGDEFAVFLPNGEDTPEIHAQLDQLSLAYREHLDKLCRRACSSISIGGVCGLVGHRLKEHIQQADDNLYWVKNNGKGSWRITPLED